MSTVLALLGYQVDAAYKAHLEALSVAFADALKETNCNVSTVNRIMVVCELLTHVDNHIEHSNQFGKLLDECKSVRYAVDNSLTKSLEILDMRSVIDFVSGSSLQEQSTT